MVRIEREVFIGFYAIRKLLETFKVSGSTKHLLVPLTSYPAISNRVSDYFNRNDLDVLYDLSNGTDEQRDLKFLCDQVVHSFAFMIEIDTNQRVRGFFISSDRMRHKRIFFVALPNLLHVFRTVGKDNPAVMSLVRNTDTHQWDERT